MNSKVLIIAGAAAVALAGAASFYVSRTIDPVEKSIQSATAPDGRYKAVAFRLSQDGAAPFCYDMASIFLAIYPDSFAESEKAYQVYWSPCATPADPAEAPKVEWLSKDLVRITYTPGPPAKDPRRLRKRVVDASRAVKVAYVERVPPY
jgi:hypothetical protein